MGTENHNATELLRSLEEWVNSEPVLQVEKLVFWVRTKCPVQIPSLSDPQCPSFRQASPGDSTVSLQLANVNGQLLRLKFLEGNLMNAMCNGSPHLYILHLVELCNDTLIT